MTGFTTEAPRSQSEHCEFMSTEQSHRVVRVDHDPLTGAVIGAAIEVHNGLGPGLLESAYQAALEAELCFRNVAFRSQVSLPVSYRGRELECGYRLDLIVDDRVVVEIKAVSALEPIHEAQLLTYLRLSGFPTGLLINFNTPVLRRGIKRMSL